MAVMLDEAGMRAIYDRIDEINEVIKEAVNTDHDLLGSISSNIQSSVVTNVINKYGEEEKSVGENTISYLTQLQTYLGAKISQYKEINENAADELQQVKTLLENNEEV